MKTIFFLVSLNYLLFQSKLIPRWFFVQNTPMSSTNELEALLDEAHESDGYYNNDEQYKSP